MYEYILLESTLNGFQEAAAICGDVDTVLDEYYKRKAEMTNDQEDFEQDIPKELKD